MACTKATIKSSLDADVEGNVIAPFRSSVPGPIELCIKDCKVLDKAGRPARMLKCDETFYLQMRIYYSELLGDLETKYTAEFHVMDLSSCKIVKAYCCSVEGNLKCDTTCTTITCEFKCTADNVGLYTVSSTIYLPKSDLVDFCCFSPCFACVPCDCQHPKPPVVG